jgi:hypothetical protein
VTRSGLLQACLAAVLVTSTIAVLAWTMPAWQVQDLSAYRSAADRLATGQPLYPPPGPVADTADVYRYAPWFAAAWIPFRPVPDDIVVIAWSGVLVLASLAAIAPLLMRRTILAWSAAALGFVLCLRAAAIGNVEPLMVAALVHGVERRSGPLWIALAASLKAAPIALALVYLGRRQWLRFGVTLVLTAVLVAPMLLFDLGDYPTGAGASVSVLGLLGPGMWIVASIVAAVVTLVLARSRWAWLSAAVAALVAIPRLGFYNAPMLLVGSATRPTTEPDEQPR